MNVGDISVFKGTVRKILFEKEDFKIVSCEPNNIISGAVKTNKWGTMTFKGTTQPLSIDGEYEITVKYDGEGKYGSEYTVVGVDKPMPTTRGQIVNFLCEFTSVQRANAIIDAYPNFIDMVSKGEKFETADIKGVGEKTIKKIAEKVISNLYLAKIHAEFSKYDCFTFSMIAKLYESYKTVDNTIYQIKKNPYKALMKLPTIGFKKADAIALEINSETRDSLDRMVACLWFLLQEAEGDGHTWISINDIYSQAISLVEEAINHFAVAIKSEEIHYDKEHDRIARKDTYLKEIYIAERFKGIINDSEAWEANGSNFSVIDGFKLTEEQMSVQDSVLRNGITVITANAGCVDGETEFFNGSKWIKIKDYNGEKVLQYNENGTTSLVYPSRFIESPCDIMYHVETSMLSQVVSPDHNMIVIDSHGEPIKMPFCDFKLSKDSLSSSFDYCVTLDGELIKGISTEIIIKQVASSNGFKYCFTVDSGVFVVRHNNKISITSNCGKSFGIKSVCEMLDSIDKTYALLTPTGKSALVLKNYTERPCSTIHKFLGFDGNGYVFNENNKVNYDVVFIDEFSMVGVDIMVDLLKAIPNTTKLVLVFDPEQLPSISKGNICYDILQQEVEGLSVNKLTKVFRYANGLLEVATKTRNGEKFLNSGIGEGQRVVIGEGNEYVFVQHEDGEAVVNKACMFYKKLMSDKGAGVDDICILSPKNIGTTGCMAINSRIQNMLQQDKPTDFITYGQTKFHVGDKVMQIRNVYDMISVDDDIDKSYTTEEVDSNCTFGVFNGMTGIVKRVYNNQIHVYFSDIEKTIIYFKEGLNLLLLAYAITIHKSQGSGYPYVILLTTKDSTFMSNRNLIYTGETRAKKALIHIGNASTLNGSLKKRVSTTRNTFLQELL